MLHILKPCFTRRSGVISRYLDTLAEFAAALDEESVPPSVRAATTRILLDTLGVIVGAAPVPEVTRLARWAGEQPGPASLLGLGASTTAELAALVNGTGANWLELDEGNHTTLGHVGIHVIPAALAMAEEVGASGRDLLAAVLAGYEVGARVARMGRLRWQVHPHGTWGAMAGAVACARLAGLGAAGIREALGLASSLALVTSRRTIAEGASVKYLWVGVAGQHAVQAVRFARCGFTAEPDGPASLFAAIGETSVPGDSVAGDLGTRWEVEHAYFKAHACCRYAAPAVDAVLAARARGPVAPEDVGAIDIVTFDHGTRLDRPGAAHELSARFSLPHCVAAALVLGSCGPEAFTAAARSDPRIQALAGRVTIREEPAFTAAFPSATPARATLRLRDGRVAEAEVRHALGDPERPIADDVLRARFLELATRAIDREAAIRARDLVQDLASLDDVRALTAWLRGPGTGRPATGDAEAGPVARDAEARSITAARGAEAAPPTPERDARPRPITPGGSDSESAPIPRPAGSTAR